MSDYIQPPKWAKNMSQEELDKLDELIVGVPEDSSAPETVVIQIGNSDDKLTQMEWHYFVNEVRVTVDQFCKQVHFAGCSRADAPWQNACFVAEVESDMKSGLIDLLRKDRMKFRQDSVAVMFGSTQFV